MSRSQAPSTHESLGTDSTAHTMRRYNADVNAMGGVGGGASSQAARAGDCVKE